MQQTKTKSAISYWNAAKYAKIEKTVMQAVPSFKDATIFDVTDQKYAKLVTKKQEVFAEGNEAGDPSQTDSPLVYKHQTVWYYGDAIKQAIQDASANGGGIVRIPAKNAKNQDNVFYTGAIRLLSHVALQVDEGATLKFMRNRTNAYYPVVLTSYEGSDIYGFSPLIYALGQHDIAIIGKGTLDGQEDMWNWRPWKKGYWGERHVENHTLDNKKYAENGILSHDNLTNTPLNKRIFTDDGHRPKTIFGLVDGQAQEIPLPDDAQVMMTSFRPNFIEPNYCQNILIKDVKILHTPFWQVHPANSQNILIDGIRIHSNKTTGYEPYGWNNDDGIDPDSCQNVVIQNVDVTVSDDGIALKAYRGNDGMLHHAPCENIIIRNSKFGNERGNSAAISAGSEMSGGIKDIFIENITFGGPGLVHAIKLKTNAYRGGYIKNIYFRNSTLNRVTWGIIQFDSDYAQTLSIPNLDVHDPVINNIFIDNVHTNTNIKHISPHKSIIDFQSAASRSPVSNIYIKNSSFYTKHSVQWAFRKNKFIHNLVLDNVKLINPQTNETTLYNLTPIDLKHEPVVTFNHQEKPITLTRVDPNADHPVINKLPSKQFYLKGQVDLTKFPAFKDGGQVKIYLDRGTRPLKVHLQSDGSFMTKNAIKLDNQKYWYRDHHYISINIYKDDHINTIVYDVQA